ncbi:hypothetical protein AB0F09_00445 [Streptomyces olivaceus]|uniref:hypothetical protein n=1 Tax=Streptomyces TaxID=1883 RepID=UPI0033FD21E4
MSYASDDPRSRLDGAPTAVQDPNAPVAEPEFFDFSELEPDETSPAGSRTWIVRAQNVVLFWTRAEAGDVLGTEDETEEYMVLLPQDTADVTLAAGADRERVEGRALAVVPPGDSTITVHTATDVVRLFGAGDAARARRARNADSYAAPHPRVARPEPWPAPPGGHRLRVHGDVDAIGREPGRLGRIFRSRAFMANFLYPYDGPRDPAKLSPHHHDDFEQLSLVVSGSFTHHVRTPWTTDRTTWRPDVHRHVGSPSVAIIPPPTVHTSEACGPGRNQMVDVFAGPRRDFSAKAGWVLNAAEYPAPGDLEVR